MQAPETLSKVLHKSLTWTQKLELAGSEEKTNLTEHWRQIKLSQLHFAQPGFFGSTGPARAQAPLTKV